MPEGVTITDIIMVVVTTVYTGFTGWLIWETRQTRGRDEEARKLNEQPQIDVFTERCDKHRSILNLVIQNNGLTGAHDIILSSKKGFSNKNVAYSEYENIKNWGPFKHGVSFLPARGERTMFLTILSDNWKEKMKTEFDVTAKYKNSYGENLEKTFIIHFKEFENTMLTPENPLYKMADYLKKINDFNSKVSNHLENIVRTLKNGLILRNNELSNINEDEIVALLKNTLNHGTSEELWLNPYIYDTQFLIKTFREILMKKSNLSKKDLEVLSILNDLHTDKFRMRENNFEQGLKKLIDTLS